MGSEDRLDVLTAEVAQLKKQLRTLKIAGATLLGGAFLLGAAGSMTVVQANRFELVDRAGEVRAVLGMRGETPFFELTGPAEPEAPLAKATPPQLDPARPVVRARGASDVEVEVVAPIEGPPPKVGAPATIRLLSEGDGARYTGVEVRCDSGFRQRVPFGEGREAVIEGMPADERCQAYFKGSSPARMYLFAGDTHTCRSNGFSPICR